MEFNWDLMIFFSVFFLLFAFIRDTFLVIGFIFGKLNSYSTEVNVSLDKEIKPNIKPQISVFRESMQQQ